MKNVPFIFNLITEGTFRPIQYNFLFFFNVFIFNWRIIASQYCVGLCCPIPLETPSRLPPHPTPLGCHRGRSVGPCIIQQILTGSLFYMW